MEAADNRHLYATKPGLILISHDMMGGSQEFFYPPLSQRR